MLVRLKQFLSPPVFLDDPDKTAVAKILNTIILFLFTALVIIGIVIPLLSRTIATHLLLVGVGFVGLVGIGYLNAKGKTTVASWSIFVLFWTLSILSFIPTGGVQAPGYSLLLFLVVLAGVLLGWRVALSVTILNAVVGLLFVWADIRQGVLPSSTLPDDDFRVWFFFTITAFLIAMLLRVGLGSIREALARAQHELHQRRLSEARFVKIFEASPNAQVISELESGIILDVNESFESLLGFSKEATLGKSATELNIYGGKGGRHVWRDMLHEQGFVHELEVSLRRKDGEILTCLLSVAAIELEGKVCAVSFAQDISERKQAEAEILQTRDDLREREAQLRTVLDNLPFLVWLKDVNGRFLMVNDRFIQENLVIERESDLIGKTDWDISLPEFAEKYTTDDTWVMENLMPLSVEESVLTANKTRFHETYKAPHFGNDKQLQGTFGFSRDITERKQAEQTLLESEARFRSIFEESAIGMVLVSMEHQIVKHNRAFAHMLGYTEDELIGQFFKDITYEDDIESSITYHTRLLRKEIANYRLEKRYMHKQGHLVWAQLNVSLVDGTQERPIYAIAQIQNINDRKQAEADREMLIEELERRNAELERFAYTVSHDLKSPLVTIGGFLGFLERDVESGDSAQLHSDINSIRNAANKMRELLDELLELSRVGRLMNPPEPISFAEIVEDALAITQGQLDGCEVDIASHEFPIVVADRTRLVEVVQNLVDNAAKFMGDQVHPRITIGMRQDEVMPVFFVQDNGIGIPPQHHEKIFDIFNKLDPNVEGTGIGLALVKRIIEVHNGRLWVESEEVGKGSTFCFTLNETAPSEVQP